MTMWGGNYKGVPQNRNETIAEAQKEAKNSWLATVLMTVHVGIEQYV